mgnify:CR=1 FL=1
MRCDMVNKNEKYGVKFKDDGRIKLLIVVGTRPEIIRLSETIKKCRKYFDCILAHTGQNYDYSLNGVFFKDLELDLPDVNLNVAGKNLGETLGNVIEKSYGLLREIKPDALLILGDTNSCLSAISAKRLHVPVFHMEAGNRSYDERLPEETNRKIVDIISDVNLAYTENARRNLLCSGLENGRVFVTGSPMAEVLRANIEKIEKSDILNRLGLEKKKYILLSAHREENIDSEKSFFTLFESVNALAEKYDMPIIYSCHPRSRKKLEETGFKLDKRVVLSEPFGFRDYCALQLNSFAVVSDSGTLPEESAFFIKEGKPFAAVCIRESTERPEALENGCFTLAGINKNGLLNAVDAAVKALNDGEIGSMPKDYEDENVSVKTVKIIQSMAQILKKSY